jgi:hypothetical protein
MLRSFIITGCLLVASATTSFAQGADFTGQLSPTVATNEQLVQQIREALLSSDLPALSQQTGRILDVGQQLEQQLSGALSTAPDDAARSRVQGVLTHTQAAVASLRMAGQGVTLDATLGRLEQARGEAQEGLDELRPFVVIVPPVVAVAPPAALPVAGSVYNPEIAALPLIGVLLIVVGFALRQAARVR